MSDIPNMFERRPEFIYKLGYGPYLAENHEGWIFMDVPELLAHRGAAQAARENAGADSAQVFTMLGDRRAIWYTEIEFKDGGGVAYGIETPREAAAVWEKKTRDVAVTAITITFRIGGAVIERVRHTNESI